VVTRQISFIGPGAPGLHIFRKFPIPRLGAVLLSTILRERGYKVKTFIEDLAALDWSFIIYLLFDFALFQRVPIYKTLLGNTK